MATPPIQNSLQVETSNLQILKIALPISLAMLVPQINFFTNNIFLGHFSEHALATASITGVYYLIFAMIGFGLNNGLQTLIARRAGENKPDEIGKIFGQGIFISIIIASTGIILTWFAAPYILKSSIRSEIIADDAITFLKIRIWGLPFLYVYQMRNALLVGTNNSKYLVSGTLAETVVNILFDYLLIFGHYGFPEMGLNGAAVASIIAEFTGMAVIFIVIHYKGITQKFSLFNHIKWDGINARRILTFSWPLIFQLAISIISWEYFYILIEHHGQEALAVSNVMRNIFGLVGCITWAFAATSATMVSNVIGQGRKDEVQFLIRKIVKLSTGSSLIITIMINIFSAQLLSIFGQGETFIVSGIPVVRVVTIAMVLMSFAVVWLNAVTGTGNTRVTFLIELIAIIIYCVYVYLALEKYFLSIMYGWMAEWLYWTGMFTMSFFYILSGKWKGKVI
ncbi:MAG: MATE family efflux transporter [Bacteroidetes bacterium]|nr:MATE family efflux transporter [Bacteroidota bacterium]MBS1930034.1 MATE family efflux transporter [Bacteroidota bacterium]